MKDELRMHIEKESYVNLAEASAYMGLTEDEALILLQDGAARVSPVNYSLWEMEGIIEFMTSGKYFTGSTVSVREQNIRKEKALLDQQKTLDMAKKDLEEALEKIPAEHRELQYSRDKIVNHALRRQNLIN